MHAQCITLSDKSQHVLHNVLANQTFLNIRCTKHLSFRYVLMCVAHCVCLQDMSTLLVHYATPYRTYPNMVGIVHE